MLLHFDLHTCFTHETWLATFASSPAIWRALAPPAEPGEWVSATAVSRYCLFFLVIPCLLWRSLAIWPVTAPTAKPPLALVTMPSWDFWAGADFSSVSPDQQCYIYLFRFSRKGADA